MIVVACGDLGKLLTTGKSKRYKHIVQNGELFAGLIEAVKIMKSVEKAEELKQFSRLHYERLRYEYSGLSSVRLSNRYVHRLIFEENEDKITLKLIEIDDTHYGNKK